MEFWTTGSSNGEWLDCAEQQTNGTQHKCTTHITQRRHIDADEDEILDGDDYVSTFVPACYLYGSLLTETIKVAVDNMGNVIGISILSPKHDCAVAQLKDLDDDNSAFNSSVLINQQVCKIQINFFSHERSKISTGLD